MRIKKIAFLVLVFFALFSISNISFANELTIPAIDFTIGQADTPDEIATSVQLLLMITILSLAPSILVMMTAFTRLIIVLSFLRRALSLQATPPNQVIIGLALFLTLFIMGPVIDDIYDNAYVPFVEGTISQEVALEEAQTPLKEFMLKQVRSKDLALFLEISGTEMTAEYMDLPLRVVIPSFIISELKTAFEIGFLLFIPFIVVDMVVASTLMALGMMMLPPVMVSLPFKILLFIMIDGWNLIVEKLILSFR